VFIWVTNFNDWPDSLQITIFVPGVIVQCFDCLSDTTTPEEKHSVIGEKCH
jgi:hypothetical protein